MYTISLAVATQLNLAKTCLKTKLLSYFSVSVSGSATPAKISGFDDPISWRIQTTPAKVSWSGFKQDLCIVLTIVKDSKRYCAPRAPRAYKQDGGRDTSVGRYRGI